MVVRHWAVARSAIDCGPAIEGMQRGGRNERLAALVAAGDIWVMDCVVNAADGECGEHKV